MKLQNSSHSSEVWVMDPSHDDPGWIPVKISISGIKKDNAANCISAAPRKVLPYVYTWAVHNLRCGVNNIKKCFLTIMATTTTSIILMAILLMNLH